MWFGKFEAAKQKLGKSMWRLSLQASKSLQKKKDSQTLTFFIITNIKLKITQQNRRCRTFGAQCFWCHHFDDCSNTWASNVIMPFRSILIGRNPTIHFLVIELQRNSTQFCIWKTWPFSAWFFPRTFYYFSIFRYFFQKRGFA